MSKAKSKDPNEPLVWTIPCGCKGRSETIKGVLIAHRWYCKEHEAEYNLKNHGKHYAIDKDGKQYDPADNA